MKRIGEILVESGFVTAAALERALAKQKEIPRRLCSLLIAHDLIDLDIASRALGEQHGVPAALRKHLDSRDRELATLFPAELARSWCILPLGRARTGALIVCARDPSPAVSAAVAALVEGMFILTVAPASVLETLVADTYGAPEEEFDVDLTTGPIHTLDLDPLPPDAAVEGFGRLQLVELDDHAVSRDPTASGTIQVGPSRQVPLPPSSAGIRVPPVEDPDVARIIDELPVGARAKTPPPPPEASPPISTPRTPARSITTPPPVAAPAEKFLRADTAHGAAPATARRPAAPIPSVISRKPPTIPPPAASSRPPATPPPPPPTPPTPPRATATAALSKPDAPRSHERAPSVPPLDLAPPQFDAKVIAVGTEPPRRKVVVVPPTSIADAVEAAAAATNVGDLTAGALRFAAGRWRAVLLLEVRDRIAAGEAGHGQLLGEDTIVALALPLAVPSLVSLAIEQLALATEPPESPVQNRLDRLLGMPRFPAAIPILVHARPKYVLVVGDAINGDADAAMKDLATLAEAVGARYTKLSR